MLTVLLCPHVWHPTRGALSDGVACPTVLVSLYILVFGNPGLPRMAGMSLGSLTTTKFLKGTRNLHAGAHPQG